MNFRRARFVMQDRQPKNRATLKVSAAFPPHIEPVEPAPDLDSLSFKLDNPAVVPIATIINNEPASANQLGHSTL